MSGEIELVSEQRSFIDVKRVGPDDLLEAFLSGRGADTLRAYDGDLRDFARSIGARDGKEALKWLVAHNQGGANAVVLEYRNSLVARGLSTATIGRRIAAVRSAVKVAKLIGLIDWTIDVQSPKVQRYRDTRGPGADGWSAIKVTAAAYAENGQPVTVRDYAIARLMRGLALRSAEVVGIDLEHLELEGTDPAVWVKGKGRTDRERLTIPAGVAEAVRAWVAIRGDFAGALFVRLDPGSLAGSPARLTTRSLRNIVPALAAKAGIRRRVHAHGLRHEAITSALTATGGDIRRVQRFSRHADPRTLLTYDDNRNDGGGDVARLLDEG